MNASVCNPSHVTAAAFERLVVAGGCGDVRVELRDEKA
jgi:hypothetical protein